MLKILISVKDNIAEIFNDPRAEINVPSAIRSFSMSVSDSPHKDDFTLYQIGTFDTNNGNVEFHEPIRIYSGHDVKVDNVTEITKEA